MSERRYQRKSSYRRLEEPCSCRRSFCGGGYYPTFYLHDVAELIIKDGKRRREDRGQLCEECIAFFDFKEELRRRRDGTNPGLAVYIVSPFSRALAGLKASNAELSDPALPTEGDEDLRREIARYRDTGKIVIVYSDGSEVDVMDPPPQETGAA